MPLVHAWKASLIVTPKLKGSLPDWAETLMAARGYSLEPGSLGEHHVGNAPDLHLYPVKSMAVLDIKCHFMAL
jgi:hypothetical protein